MRVLMLHSDYQQVGGEYHSVRLEASGLLTAGVEVRLLLTDSTPIVTGGPFDKAVGVTRQPQSYALVREAIQEFQPDLVHAQNLFPTLGAGAIRAFSDAGVPWVRTLRNYRLACIAGDLRLDGEDCARCCSAADGYLGVLHGCYRASRMQSCGAVAYARFEQRAAKRHPPVAYLVLSGWMRSILHEMFGDAEVFVHPNAVAPSDGVPIDRSVRTHDAVFVGRLSSEKGPELVLGVAERLPNLRFALIGDGPLRKELENLSPPNVDLIGELAHDDVMKTMAHAASVLVPSRWNEPFGRVAAESLSVGTPPIVSARGGLPDIVSGLPQGLVCQTENADEWASAVERIACLSQAQYNELARGCLDRWQAEYALKGLSSRLVRIYKSVLR